jgi:hypothetical protein
MQAFSVKIALCTCVCDKVCVNEVRGKIVAKCDRDFKLFEVVVCGARTCCNLVSDPFVCFTWRTRGTSVEN